MSNNIFVVGNGGLKGVDTAGHLFGGLMNGAGNYSAIHLGVDFGGEFEKIKRDGEIGKVSTQDLILIPISEASAAECAMILNNLHDLNEEGRWPFEFCSGEPPVHPVFKPYKTEEYQDVPRQKAEANCVTFFNWVARASGIDLNILHPDWKNLTRAKASNVIFNEIFDKHLINKEQIGNPVPHITGVIKPKRGYQAIMVRHTGETEALTYAFHLAAAVARGMGGYDKLTAFMDKQKPFECEEEALDEYLESEFDYTY